jgi:two-component system nitrogen regulation response regulator NtrX
VETFLKDFAVLNRSKKKKITPDALNILSRYAWPGNVRELKNLVERLAIMVEDEAIDGKDVPEAYNQDAGSITELAELKLLELDNFKAAKSAFEEEFINRKLIRYQNNITKTAEAIGVGRSFLHKKLKSFKR